MQQTEKNNKKIENLQANARKRRAKWLSDPENREKDKKAALERYYKRKKRRELNKLLGVE